MNGNDSDAGREGLDGLSLEAAVDAVVADPADSAAVREALAVVTEDGVVRRAAVGDAVARASEAAATAERRIERTAAKLADVHSMADPVSDLDVAAARLESFDARLDRLEERLATLSERVHRAAEHGDSANLYALGLELREATTAAEELAAEADRFQFDLDDLGAWLDDPGRRGEELLADVDALAGSLESLETDVDALAAGDVGTEDPAVAWAEAAIRHRVTGAVLSDLRAELAALRTWADREGTERPPDVAPRLDALAARRDDAGGRLAALAEPAWRDRFGDRLRGLEDTIETMEPPVAWGEIEAVMERYRPETE